jgi:hypothetical protein
LKSTSTTTRVRTDLEACSLMHPDNTGALLENVN